MAHLETLDAKLQASATFTRSAATTAALAVFLMGSQSYAQAQTHARAEGTNRQIRAWQWNQPVVDKLSDTAQLTLEVQTTPSDVWHAILQLHDELVREQIDLPVDERVLIHRRLWDLYE